MMNPPGIPQVRNIGPTFWPFEGEYLKNGSKSQHYMSITA